MDPQPDVIRQQIDQTRSSLTEKLETLEAEVKETVVTAKQTVEGTINSVKETVHNARETVKRTFDLEYQVSAHPWALLGLSLVSGAAAGVVLGSRLRSNRRWQRRLAETPVERFEHTEPVVAWERTPLEAPARPGFLDLLGRQIGEELEKVKEQAVHTLGSVVNHVAQRSITALGAAAEEMMVRAATQCAAAAHEPTEGEPPRGTGYQTPPAF